VSHAHVARGHPPARDGQRLATERAPGGDERRLGHGLRGLAIPGVVHEHLAWAVANKEHGVLVQRRAHGSLGALPGDPRDVGAKGQGGPHLDRLAARDAGEQFGERRPAQVQAAAWQDAVEKAGQRAVVDAEAVGVDVHAADEPDVGIAPAEHLAVRSEPPRRRVQG
jgi:hypothetical protein